MATKPSAPSSGDVSLGMRCELLSSSLSSGSGLRASIKRYGEVAYIGAVRSLPAGEWFGVKLDKPLGKNDGSVDGARYFTCAPLHGAFVRHEKLNTHGDFPVLATHAESIEHAMEERRRALDDKKQLGKMQRAMDHEQSGDDLVQSFWHRFTSQEDDLRKQLNAFVEQKKQPTPCEPPRTKEVTLDELVIRIGEMRDDAASAASMYLSPYDIRQTQSIVAKLLENVEATRTTFAPRKKFTFRARAKKSATVSSNNNDSIRNDDGKPEKEPTATQESKSNQQLFNMDELVHANKHDEVIIIDHTSFADDPTKRRDLNFSHLKNCVIFVCVDTSAIRGDDLQSCMVFTGPVWGSIWLENCDSCEFTVACRQLRVHQSSATTFHLRIASHPIIEDCHALQFAPYRLQYDGLSEQLEKIGLHKDSGLWARVNDFKWHKAQQSPNWSVRDPKLPLKPVPAALASLVTLA